jgi:phosphohistidine phosphatase
MPSRIYLLRHAKAAVALPGQKDFDRNLVESGQTMAARLGETMLGNGFVPEVVICSPSARTRETWAAVAGFLPFDIEAGFDRSLYDGAPGSYLKAIRSAGNAASVMIVGHNPMTEETALELAGSGEPGAINALNMGYPTAGLAIFDQDEALEHTTPGRARLVAFITGGTM